MYFINVYWRFGHKQQLDISIVAIKIPPNKTVIDYETINESPSGEY